MMLTVESIPDIKPHSHVSTTTTTTITTSNRSPEVLSSQNFTISDDVLYIDEDDESNKNIPYHARQDSRPFTYGTMIGDSKGLSSPSLVRKASFNKSTGDTLKKVQTQVYPDFSTSNRSTSAINNNDYGSKYNTMSSYSSNTYKGDHDDDALETLLNEVSYLEHQQPRQPYRRDFRQEYYKEEAKRYDPLKRSYTDGTLRKSPDKITSYKTSTSVVTSPYSDTESLSPPSGFRNNTKSPEFHET